MLLVCNMRTRLQFSMALKTHVAGFVVQQRESWTTCFADWQASNRPSINPRIFLTSPVPTDPANTMA